MASTSASQAIFSSPSPEAFLAPVDLPNAAAVVETLRTLCTELLSRRRTKTTSPSSFHVKCCRSLIRTILVISILLDSCCCNLSFSEFFTPTALLCFKELYLLLYRSKILIDYVQGSTSLWLLLHHHTISAHFHHLNNEFSTLLDVFPLAEIQFSKDDDVQEHIQLLRKQSNMPKKLSISDDACIDVLRLRLYYFLNEMENGRIPGRKELDTFFAGELGIASAKSFRAEINFFEEQMVNHGGDVVPTASIVHGLLALLRYCRFLMFSFEDEDDEPEKWRRRSMKKGLISKEIAETFKTIPKDFCCPISLDLMQDPVLVSTGQTYDRSSIERWMEEGQCNCPKTGQMLLHTDLVPNQALRSLISQWTTANGIPYGLIDNVDCDFCAGKGAAEANKATVNLLVEELANGTTRAKAVAAREIRMLAKMGMENRACIGEAGAIPLLGQLLLSEDIDAQENSVTAMLNLSIYDKNKSRIIQAEACLGAIVTVLRRGHTTEARENAAATLFSLSAVHDYKRRIAWEDGAVEALAGLLSNGTSRGKKDAVTALYNLSTHNDNCRRMIDSRAVAALIAALRCEGVSEEATAALALIARRHIGAAAVGKEAAAVAGLVGVLRSATPRGKENAAAVLLELCRSGCAERVVKAPELASLVQVLLFTGTKRARRKAASLARVFRRCEGDGDGAAASLHLGGLGVGYAFAGDVALSSVSISVSVL
ncbi:U-box domain-containing protein 17-like [Andrographis paniculata]|uniref:U-box domain-containing protein 17-like n=1 Tax=Andrographis paniculata TaxID=175694 RepID=UPI0021E766AE|nr:U-box domain-containing protein 17-like [Andrographis paniculata]